ncbi:MAG: histidine phosphatase family protein [Deltaproteobacteria bacterium]|nr:histidine phosphatase family protein [Deltaproteobacteria bacterium]
MSIIPVTDDPLVVALIRHGRTAWNHERRFLGRTDIPLDAVGQEQAALLGRRFGGRFDLVLSSPLSRALETARALDPNPEVRPALAELSQGVLEGLGPAEAASRWGPQLRAWSEDPSAWDIPGGEPLSLGLGRVREELDRLPAALPDGGVVALVSHQLVLATLVAALLGEPPRAWREHRLENTGIYWIAGPPWRVVGR